VQATASGIRQLTKWQGPFPPAASDPTGGREPTYDGLTDLFPIAAGRWPPQYTRSLGSTSRAQALTPGRRFFYLRNPVPASTSTARGERLPPRGEAQCPWHSTRAKVPLHLLELFLRDLALGVAPFQDIQGGLGGGSCGRRA